MSCRNKVSIIILNTYYVTGSWNLWKKSCENIQLWKYCLQEGYKASMKWAYSSASSFDEEKCHKRYKSREDGFQT